MICCVSEPIIVMISVRSIYMTNGLTNTSISTHSRMDDPRDGKTVSGDLVLKDGKICQPLRSSDNRTNYTSISALRSFQVISDRRASFFGLIQDGSPYASIIEVSESILTIVI